MLLREFSYYYSYLPGCLILSATNLVLSLTDSDEGIFSRRQSVSLVSLSRASTCCFSKIFKYLNAKTVVYLFVKNTCLMSFFKNTGPRPLQ